MPATPTGRGAQVVLDPLGDIAKAARGAYASTLELNVFKRRSDVSAGLIADGNTPDGRPSNGTTAVDLLAAPSVVAKQQVLYATASAAGTGNSATTIEEVLASVAVPANTWRNAGDRLVIEAGGTFAASTDNKNVRFRFDGGTPFGSVAVTGAAQIFWSFRVVVQHFGFNAQSVISLGGGSNVAAFTGGNLSLDPTVAHTLTLCVQNITNSVAGSITYRYLTVDVIRV